MRPILTCAFVAAVIASVPLTAAAQTPSSPPAIVEVRLRDGSVVFGQIVTDEPSRLVLRTVGGAEVAVSRDQVRSIQATAGEVVEGEFWADDVIASKLFLGATGRSLKRGEGYFAVDALFLPAFQVGVTDRFSIGLGAPFYGFAKSAWITPKFQLYRSDKLAIATGVLHLFVPDFGLGGYGYVVATTGTPNGAVTFGGGLLYGSDDDSSDTLPMFTLGGERRLGRRTKFVTENYIFKEGVIVTAGARIVGQAFSFETGLIVAVTSEGTAPPGPFFNVIWHSRPTPRR